MRQSPERFKEPGITSLLAALAAIPVLSIFALAQSVPPVVINVKSQPASTLAFGFSGLNVPQPRNGVEYFDSKFVSAVKALKPGWVRFPGGTASMAFDWNPANPTGGHINVDWMNSLLLSNPPQVTGQSASILAASQWLTQVKGGVYLSDFATFAHALGAAAILCFNTFTDKNPGSAMQMAQAAQSLNLHVTDWELGNEAYLYPLIPNFQTATSYGTESLLYYNGIQAGTPGATVGLFYGGLYPGVFKNPSGVACYPGTACFQPWDSGLQAYNPAPYWNSASNHIYPITQVLTVQNTMFVLNGILAHGSSDYMNNYLIPLLPANTSIFITEFNCCTSYADEFLSYIYNGIFLAEYTARLTTVPAVKGVGINSAYTDNTDYHGLIQSVDDFEPYLLNAYNMGEVINTATNPDTQYQFYTSAPGLAMTVANQAINTAKQTLPTTVTGGSTVKIKGFDGANVPAVFAQAYLPGNGRHNLLITNKSSQVQAVTVQLNGQNVTSQLNLMYVSNTNPGAANTAIAPNTVQIQKVSSANPVQIQPYSVTTVTW